MRQPHVVITTNGITGTKVFIDEKEINGVVGIRFSQSYKKNHGLPILQIDVNATNVTLDTRMLPTLPEPFRSSYVPISSLLNSKIPTEMIMDICRERGIDLVL